MAGFGFAGESPFWYFLARRAETDAVARLPVVLQGLNARASQLRLPIAFKPPHATAWAVLCQLFNVTQPQAESIGRMGFSVMKVGFGRVFGPKAFVDTAMHRILGNIQEPAFPGRSGAESVVDTFLANGLKLVDAEAVPSEMDAVIVTTCLQDRTMYSLGEQACQARPGLWDSTVEEYSRRRPGWIRRNFSDPNVWLFDS